MNLPIKIFYHMYCINDCLDRFTKTYIKIQTSGLLNKCEKIYLILVGPNKDSIYDKVVNLHKVVAIKKDKDSSEIETLNFLWEMSQTEIFQCLYLHSKGVTHSNKDNIKNIDAWIDYIEYFCIYKHEQCLYKLEEGNTCGVEIREYFNSNINKHYCGNIWWSGSNYIKNLINPFDYFSNCVRTSLLDIRHQCEFWVTDNINNVPITLNQSYSDFEFHFYKFPEMWYRVDSKSWTFDKLNIPTAWSGLEDYILPIMQSFGVKNNLMLEFGVDFGYSTYIFSRIFKKVIGVDTFEGDIHIGHDQGDDFYYKVKEQFKNSNIDLYRMNYKNFIKNNNDRFDLIHIDIVHTYNETYECAEWSMHHSDVVILHDTVSFPEIHRVCQDLSLKYKWGFVNIEEHCGLGILYKQY